MGTKTIKAVVTLVVIAYVGMETQKIISIILDDYYKKVDQIRTGRNRSQREFNGWDGLLKVDVDI